MSEPSFQVWFAVRYLHVASAALLAGGATIVASCCLVPRVSRSSDAALLAAPLYEWIFWSLIAAIVATGVSNLGLKGDGLMGSATSWGKALTAKLGAVLALLALSLVRSGFVIRCAGAAAACTTARARTILGALYGVTVVLLLGALWMGLGLAHGRY
jgi:hypothetical protein